MEEEADRGERKAKESGRERRERGLSWRVIDVVVGPLRSRPWLPRKGYTCARPRRTDWSR